MNNQTLSIINITPLLAHSLGDIVADLKQLWEARAITAVAFSCSLQPEGDPPHDKALLYAEKFESFRVRLDDFGLPAGLLMQSTMGHRAQQEPAPYQPLVRSDGVQLDTYCPLDQDFLAYIHKAVKTLAEQQPGFMILDDDARLLTGRDSCYCPLHIAEFNRHATASYTRETLLSEMKNNQETARRYDEFLLQSILSLAETARWAIDSVDDSLPGIFCLCASDIRHAPDMARTFAAQNQTPWVRINQALYKKDSPRLFPGWRQKTASQISWLPSDYFILSETDSCPQNRYSTSAVLLHAHLTWSLLLGTRGAKLWITMTNEHQPGSGREYRRTLVRHAGFYRTISQLRLRRISLCEPLSASPPFLVPPCLHESKRTDSWGSLAFGFMGIPSHLGLADDLNPKVLSGPSVDGLTEADLQRIMAGNVLLDGAAAIALSNRGFSDKTGVVAKPWALPRVTYELWNGKRMRGGKAFADLRELHPETDVLSDLFHSPFTTSPESDRIAPGAVAWSHSEGNTIITLAAQLVPFEQGFSPFNMLNEVRKNQLIDFLIRLNALPLYLTGDAEVMLDVARLDDGSFLVGGLNIGLDPLPSIPLAGSLAVSPRVVEYLTPDGDWSALPVSETDDGIDIALSVPACMPFILRIVK